MEDAVVRRARVRVARCVRARGLRRLARGRGDRGARPGAPRGIAARCRGRGTCPWPLDPGCGCERRPQVIREDRAVRGSGDLDRHLRHRRVGAPGARGPRHGRPRHPDDLPADLQLQPEPAVRVSRRRRGDRGRGAPAGARGGGLVPARVPRPPGRPPAHGTVDPVRDGPRQPVRLVRPRHRVAGGPPAEPPDRAAPPPFGHDPSRGGRRLPARRHRGLAATGWFGPSRTSGRASRGAASPTPTTSSFR